jgi:PAS domain S-box-containing protein
MARVVHTIPKATHSGQVPYTSAMAQPHRTFPPALAKNRATQPLRRWWTRLTPHRQDRFAVLAPLLAVVLFIAAIIAVFLYLRMEELAREREAIARDVEYSQQHLRLRLLEQQEQIARLGREVSNRAFTHQEFMSRAENLANAYMEIQSVSWVDARTRFRWTYRVPTMAEASAGNQQPSLSGPTMLADLKRARDQMAPLYTVPLAQHGRTGMLRLLAPLFDKSTFRGNLIVEYSLDGLYLYGLPADMSTRYALSLRDRQGLVLAGTITNETKLKRNWLPWANPINASELPVIPVGSDLRLRGQAYRTSQGLISGGMFWLLMVLSVVTAWLLIANWRHTRRRLQAQEALVQETSFRRAMEESMLTGMRAMDMDGRITYVNKGFCRMTGWTEEDLVGTTAPFPYWPEEDFDILNSRMQEELSGGTQSQGIQFRLKRKDGVLIDARIYVSPLLDAFGKQTGWMTSMTDITEPNRVRMQLAAAHERFTTVLEALDASISVAPIDSDEMLFTNKLYRLWFGTKAQGHLRLIAEAGSLQVPSGLVDSVDELAGLPTEALTAKEVESAEIYLGNLGRWLEVRARYLTWVDGRLAQMVIATDITARRMAEEQSELEAARAQASSRLIAMGEMASSVAHELNQPLTAINNYCNGMVSRVKGKQIDTEALLTALEKTAHQAHRAGQIIQRIRAFVRRSEPNRSPAAVRTIVSEAVELAEIELRRRNVKLQQNLAPDLPEVLVDKILIEQVLLNLMKNAAEAIDTANRPSSQRLVQLTISNAWMEGKPAIEFVVVDSGPGITPEVMSRLFEAFYTTKSEGMGMGLSLCRSIVESHTGRLKAENIYNGSEVVGCKFSFWLPAMTSASGMPESISATEQIQVTS